VWKLAIVLLQFVVVTYKCSVNVFTNPILVYSH
jgi:hypothetical protein